MCGKGPDGVGRGRAGTLHCLELELRGCPHLMYQKREDGQAGAGAPQLTRTGDEQASLLITGLWVVKENELDSDAAISQQG